jgi:succinate dehydrogenase / fumarate reductase, cytochrome b subunit
MTTIQIGFLLLLSISFIVILGFIYKVWKVALFADGGPNPSFSRLAKLGRLPAERVEISRWASYFHRVSGFAIFGFLSLHIIDVSTIAFSHGAYDSLHAIYSTWPMRLIECGLLFALVFHALNGIRLIIVDVFDVGIRKSNILLRVLLIISIITTLGGSFIILQPVFN